MTTFLSGNHVNTNFLIQCSCFKNTSKSHFYSLHTLLSRLKPILTCEEDTVEQWHKKELEFIPDRVLWQYWWVWTVCVCVSGSNTSLDIGWSCSTAERSTSVGVCIACRVVSFRARQVASSPIISGQITSSQKIFQQIPSTSISSQLIVSVLQRTTVDFIPSVFHFWAWCFLIQTACTMQWTKLYFRDGSKIRLFSLLTKVSN